MNKPSNSLRWFLAVFFGVALVSRSPAAQFYYFETNAFPVYEGGAISGTLHRNDLTGPSDVCILLITNVSGIAPVNTSSDLTGLPVNPGACDQPFNPTALAHFNSGSFTASFSLGVVNNGSVQAERGMVLYIGPDFDWGAPAAPSTNYVQLAWAYLEDNDRPVTVSPYFTSQLEGYVNAFTFSRPTNNFHAPITIRFTLSGSATLNTDYQISVDAPLTLVTGTTNQLTIPGSDIYPYTDALLYVTVLNDSVSDLDETVTARIEPNSAQYTMPGTTTATVTNLDDTPTVEVFLIHQTMTEGAGQIGVVVARSFCYPGTSSKTVNLSIGGTATPGTDYTNSLPTSVTIPSSQLYVTNWITPLADTNVEGVETVGVTVLPGNYYVVSPTASNAIAYIEDDYPVINVQATDNYAIEPGSNQGSFLITRIGNFSKAVTVQLKITGSAVAGADYVALATNITLGAGVSYTNLIVTPIANDGAEAAETVVVSLKTNASYLLGLYTNAVVTIASEAAVARDSYPKSERYLRGSGTNLDLYTMVIPLDGIKGTRRNDVEALGYTMAYHYNATNSGNQLYATNRIAFNTPVVAFGESWGTPLYLGRSYSLGAYCGLPATNPIVIYAFRRSDGGLEGTTSISFPDINSVTNWTAYATNGFAKSATGYGLTTVLRTGPDLQWGTTFYGFALTHTATDAATNYVFLVAAAGSMNSQYAAINSANQPAYDYLYELNFGVLPGWRSVFIDQPHFHTSPLPPDLLNRTPDELLNYGAVVTNAVSLSPTACTNLDQSPELRRHPTLDQFVADLNRDPLALANYVQNEIELTDPLGYREDGQIEKEAVYQGGVNRGALGVYLEGQGSPTEQCALLIYFLRQAGYPATYIFPPEGGLKMLDTRLSALLRMRINGAHDELGRLYTTNQLIAVNYPWVATYISNQWVHVFPWLKDYSVEEGLNVCDYLPDPYKQTQLWVKDYVLGKTNLLAFATLSDDTPSTIFPRWLDNTLKQTTPGISLDDIGIRYVNRRHLYAQWSDLPRPTWVTNTSTAAESLAASTNLFDTVQVQLYSVANPQKSVLTPPLRMADLHNRKFFLTHTNAGNGQVQAQLILGPYTSGTTNLGSFGVSDTTLTNKQLLTLALDDTDDRLKLQLRHRRQGAIAWETALQLNTSFLNLSAERELLTERPLRKGDSAAICVNPGRVTPAMLRVHAQELWNMEQMLSTNTAATNQVSVDVYQGSLLYLAGMSYYERGARSDAFLQDLFKVRTLSRFAMGLSKLSPRRNVDGTLYNGPLDPIWPNVDMFFSDSTIAGNGTVRQDSGWTHEAAERNYQNLSAAYLSAQEHAVLDIFFGQSNSVSTVKLLQQAQAKVASGGSNVVEVSIYNVLSAGTNVYNGKALQDHDPEIWSQVVDTFLYGGAPEYTVGWLTPGAQTTASGSFSGMSALVFAPYRRVALIGDNQNGGYANALPYNSVSAANSPWIEIRSDADGNYYSSYSAPVANQRVPGGEVTTVFDLLADYYSYNNSSYVPNPNQSLQGILNDLMLNGAPGTYQDSLPAVADQGLPSTKTDYRLGNGLIAHVEDPVNALTGEFYIDDVDLSLPGPMPLQVRRNYGSQNLADNQLGYGWKLNYMPYLSVATVSNIIYEAEPDGSVLAFGPIGTNLWAPTLALNPTLNNNSANGIGSVANRLNGRLTKASTNYFLTSGDGSLRVFQEMSFPLTNSASWDRFRPYLTYWYDNRSNFYRFEYGTNSLQADYGQVRRVICSSGNILRFQYDPYGRVVDAYSLDGRRVQYDFDKHGDLVTVTLPDTAQINYEYQLLTWSTNSVTNVYSTHLLVKELKPDGRALKNDYDEQRRVTNQWSTVGPDLRLVRNASFRYTNNFNLTNLTATLNGTTTILDYTNSVTTYYYTNGLIRRIRDPLGAELAQEWYEANETNAPAYPRSLKAITDKRGLVTTFFYDSRGNLTNTTSRGDLLGDGNTNTTATTLALYATNNLPTKTVDASGATNLYFYTNTWLLARMEIWPSNAAPAQAITNLYSYSDVTNTTDGTVSYGLRVREVRAAFSPDAATNEWVYSSRGFPTKQTRYTGTGDPAVIVTNVFNTRGELAVQTDAAGRRAAFGFDPRGNIESREVFEAGQSVPMAWEYFYYNENGELTWSDGPRFNPEDYVWRDYDGAGRQTQEIRWRSRAKFDGSGVEAVPGDDLYATTFLEYDAFNNLTKVTDPRGNYSRKKYDVLGRLVREEFYDTQDALLATNGFTYNLAGDMTNAFNALGGSAQRQYTSTGKPKFQRHADGSTNAWLYYADGRVRREIQNNGAYWERTYDDANRKATLIFRSAAGAALATNVWELDQRGNLVRRTDAGGFVFTNLFDGLDRLKVSAGPAVVTVRENCGLTPGCGVYVTNILQQMVTSYYDAAGIFATNVNALGEKTITRLDALGRPVGLEIRDTNNVVVRATTAGYSTDHHGVSVTNGSGTSAIISTTYTDNDGQRLLSVGYPWSNVREFSLDNYDLAGNVIFQGRYAATNSSLVFFSSNSFAYDGLNRLKQQRDRDNALSTFAYDAAGNVTNRTMPGGLQWTAIYNNAGQMLREWNTGQGGAGTRTNAYAYFTAGDALAGLVKATTNAVGIWCAYTYDDFLRTASTLRDSPSDPSMQTTWGYDARGLVTQITETFGANTVTVYRSPDAYGQNLLEVTSGVNFYSYAMQNWDAAGRRSRLDIFAQGYTRETRDFGWQADGQLASVSSRFGAPSSYGYTTAGILTNRTTGNRTVSVSALDGGGRPLSITTKVNTLTKLTETLAWTGDGLLNTHTLAREDFTDSRAYDYAAWSRRLSTERLNLDGAKRWTNSFSYDGETAGGPGALTKVGPVSGAARWNGGKDAFSRISTATNTYSTRVANGRANGPSTITATLDGLSVPLAIADALTGNWPISWQASLQLSPGAHQLSVTAAHPSGQFNTNRSAWFTNNVANETVTDTFDAAGRLTYRVWKNPNGTTNRTETLTWDVKGRLSGVNGADAQGNGCGWSATYDPLNRKIFTQNWLTTNGNSVAGSLHQVSSHYDPEVEFLELGVIADGRTTWKQYGPDLNGVYGGMNGVGGLEGTVTDFGLLQPTISDARGNVLGLVTNGVVRWAPARPSGYGAPPGYEPLSLTTGGSVAESSAWHGKWPEANGYLWLGARYYDPESGGFLNSDPVWNGGDPNYYTFAGGDPINYFDPDGRMGTSHDATAALYMDLYTAWQEERRIKYIGGVAGASATGDIYRIANALSGGDLANDFDNFAANLVRGATQGDFADNTGFGGAVGQTGAGLIPIYGQIGDARDTAAAFGNFGNGGWRHWQSYANLGAVGVAWVPGFDWVKAGRKLAHGTETVAHVGVPHTPHVEPPHTPHTPVTPPSTPPVNPKPAPNHLTGQGYGVNDPAVRIQGNWSINDMKQALLGHPPRGLGSPDLHHAGQMPGSGIHEIIPDLHRTNPALHPNQFNQGVTDLMREQDRQLHWWYRAREQGADQVLPGWIHDP